MSISIDSAINPLKVTGTANSISTSEDSKIDSQKTLEPKIDKFEYSQPQQKKLILACDSQIAINSAKALIEGKQSTEEYKASFKADFYNVLNFNVEHGYTTTTDKADILKILETSYNGYKNGALDAAVIESNADGFRKYGAEDRSAVYYSADYYYKGEEVKSALKECYTEINAELNLGQTDVPKTSQYETYNDVWVQTVRSETTFDAKKAGAPPEGFEMHYIPQKYPASEFKNNHQSYRLIAGNNSAEDSAVLYIDVPNSLSLFKKNSALNNSILKNLLSKDNTQEGTISYNITDLIDNYPGKDITARLTAFVAANCINEQAGALKASCGDWSMETDIPFSTLTKTFACKGSEITSSYSGDKSNSSAVAYLDNFTFEKYPIFEQIKRQGL